MNHRTRLGPIAIFLAVVMMVMTTMALLTLATSNADRTMAGRFASVTQTRYQLEADAERFMSDAAATHAGGVDFGTVEAVGRTDRGYQFYEELNGYSITVEITVPDDKGNFDVLEWKVSKLWNAKGPESGIWQGF